MGGPHRFTNTAVPRFDGTGCWQQHLLVIQAITKSNRWSPDTAAIQLFAHLDREALQAAILMPDRIRECWKDFVDELSAYYNTSGRLAATFATELGILAIRGFSDMKEKVRCTTSLSRLNKVVTCVDIWIVLRRRRQLGTL